MQAAAILEAYSSLEVTCSRCGHIQRHDVPVDLTALQCQTCQSTVDPVEWKPFGAVSHSLMRRLIYTCYKHTDFAQEVLKLYRYNRDVAKNEDWGIDKSLLAVHATNSLVLQSRDTSSWLSILSCLLMAISLPIGFWTPPLGCLVVLTLLASRDARRVHRERFLDLRRYDPTVVETQNLARIDDVLQYIEGTQPKNLFFFRSYNPFISVGDEDGTWSLLIDRRKLEGGEVVDGPVDLDLNETYAEIVQRVCQMTGPGTAPTRFQVNDIAMVSGQGIEVSDRRFLNEELYPQREMAPEVLRSLHEADDQRFKVFKRITFYHPQRDISVSSFVRLQHQGPFTYIESIGTRLLPLTNLLFRRFADRETADERQLHEEGPAWWSAIDYEERQRFKFIACHTVMTLLIWVGVGYSSGYLPSSGADIFRAFFSGDSQSTYYSLRGFLGAIAAMNAPHLTYLLFVTLASRQVEQVPDLKWDDPHQVSSRFPFLRLLLFLLLLLLTFPWFFALLLFPEGRKLLKREVIQFASVPWRNIFSGFWNSGVDEKLRLKRRRRIRHEKECGEFNYGPPSFSLRYSQSAYSPINFFDETDLRLLRRTQETAIQEAFIQCLTKAGIDTSDFRKGVTQMTNYGIINSGHIGGEAQSRVKVTESGANPLVGKLQAEVDKLQSTFQNTSSRPQPPK